MYQSQNKRSPLNYGLFLLSRRDYGVYEISQKITEKYGAEESEEAVKILQDKQFLDDERFVKNFVKLKSSSKSKQYIKFKLKSVKISLELIEKIFEEEYPEEKELENIRTLAERYVKKKEGDQNLYQKTGSFLLRRGFSYEIVKKVLREIL